MNLRDVIVELRRIGIKAIEAHVAALGDRLLAGLEAIGAYLLTPVSRPRRARIVTFGTNALAQVAEQLDQHEIDVWSRNGLVRISFPACTIPEDIDWCLSVLRQSLGEVPHLERIQHDRC